MTTGPGSPSKLRRIVLGLARIGLDLRPASNRARDFMLRPARHELAAVREEAARLQISLTALQNSLTSQQRMLAALRDDIAGITGRIEALRHEQQSCAASLERKLHEATDQSRRELTLQHAETQNQVTTLLDAERHERRSRVALLERLVSSGPRLEPARIEPDDAGPPAVSIILPTHNRARHLADAVASVRAQHFTDWELIVVDDGSTDDTPAALAPHLADPRIRTIRQIHLGAARARNHGLALARGALIAYVDSDNLWFPGFLSEAVQALRDDPATDLLYGVLVSDSHDLDERCLLFRPFDRDQLLAGNFIDLNTVLHRRSLIAAYGGFDEAIDRLQDWDLLLRYTAHAPARGVPVLAARYRVCDDLRITQTVAAGPNWAAIRQKQYPAVSPQRQQRVLYVLWHYPQLSETYMETEIRCMRRWGAHVEVWRAVLPASPYATSTPIHDGSLEDAVRLVRPDLIHIHWLSFAVSQQEVLARFGLPVTIRLHSFDVTAQGLRLLLENPWVRAVYAFPPQIRLLDPPDARLKPIPVAFESALFRPRVQKNRRLVVRTGAALPSKDIPFFFELAKRLPEYRFVFAGVACNGVEAYVDTLRELRTRMNSPVELRFDVPRDVVAELVAEAAIYVHTINPPGSEHATPIGMPISIAEAMATGAYVLARETPELAAFVGDAGTLYRDLDHAAALIAATAGWTEKMWREAWMRSVDRAFINHADGIVLRPIFEDWCAMVRPGG